MLCPPAIDCGSPQTLGTAARLRSILASVVISHLARACAQDTGSKTGPHSQVVVQLPWEMRPKHIRIVIVSPGHLVVVSQAKPTTAIVAAHSLQRGMYDHMSATD